MFHNTSESEPN